MDTTFDDPTADRSSAARAKFRREWWELLRAVLIAGLIAWAAVAGGAWGRWFAIFVVLLRLGAITESVDTTNEVLDIRHRLHHPKD